MYSFLMFIYIVVCFGLILVVLLQSSKGGGLAGAFGGGGGDSAVFGGRGAASFLSKLTTYLVVAFMGLALVISLLSKSSTDNSGLVQQEQSKRATATVNPTPASGLQIVPSDEDANVIPVETDGGATQSESEQ